VGIVFGKVIGTPQSNGSFLPNDRLHKNSYTLFLSQILKRLVHLKHPVFVARILLVSEIFDANSCESFVQSSPILHQTPAHSTIRQSISLLWEHVKTPERFSYSRNASS
jgi:hypothetical protein